MSRLRSARQPPPCPSHAAQPPRLLTTTSAPFSPADAAPAAAETGCCATEARTPRRPGHSVHPATHNRPNTGAQPPLHAPAQHRAVEHHPAARYRTLLRRQFGGDSQLNLDL